MNRTILRNFTKFLVVTVWSAVWAEACTSPSYTVPDTSSSSTAAGTSSGGASNRRSAGNGATADETDAGTGSTDGLAGTAGVGGSDPLRWPIDCDGDGDCVGARATHVCDVASQICVECLPGRTGCGPGLYCGADKECHVGCAAATDCLTSKCDPTLSRCTDCKTGADCSAGSRCDLTLGICVPGCDDSSSCPKGWVCCAGACANLTLDESNCGSCGSSCVRPNAEVSCSETGCHLLECKTGYADCNGKLGDGCEAETSSNLENCGSCGHACPSHLVCKSGECVAADCGAGYRNCDARDENGCETNVLRDVLNCGACSSPCSTANGIPSCDAGTCQMTCASGWGDCDGNPLNGCESESAIDAKNCGRCGATCTNTHGDTACVANRCTPSCLNGYGDCDGVSSNGCETDVLADVNNCSGCGKPCKLPNATASCSAGQCAIASCATGWADCNGKPEDGCEVNVESDVDNCSKCGAACSKTNGTAGCSSGQCTIECAPDFGDCSGTNDGCETDLTTSLSHCGSCDTACTAPANATAICYAKTCAFGCISGFDDCNTLASDGCEANLATDAMNCGKCKNACVAGCTGGTCDTPCTGKACTTIKKVTRAMPANFYDKFGATSLCYEALNVPMTGGRTDSFGGTLRINGSSVTLVNGGNWASLPPILNGGYCIEVIGGTSADSSITIW